MTTQKFSAAKSTDSTVVLSTMNWNEVCEPGIYVDNQYPRYFRVTEDSIVPGGSPVIHSNDFIVTKITADPFAPLARIQHLCANNNLPVVR